MMVTSDHEQAELRVARILVSSKLSERISETPEGFLLCEGVPIARTGRLEYAAGETTIEARGGVVEIYRDAETLFSPETLASFEGKPFTVDHPSDEVTPDTWKQDAAGHVQNVRRGEGAESDLLLADVLVMERRAIDLIQGRGLREISCGYDTDYEEVAPGVGRQVRIIGNHVALVTAGRCGPRCAIRDGKPGMSGSLLKLLGIPGFRKALDADPKARRAFDEAVAGDEPEKDSAPNEPDAAATDGGADKLDEILLMLRTLVEKLDGARTGDQEAREPTSDEREDDGEDPEQARDDTGGLEVVTKDHGGGRRTCDRATADAARLLGVAAYEGDRERIVLRQALRAASADPALVRVVDGVRGGRALAALSDPELRAAFGAVLATKRALNSVQTADALTRPGRDARPRGSVPSPRELNELFEEHYADRKGSW